MDKQIHDIGSSIAAIYESLRMLERGQLDNEISQRLISLSSSRVEQLVVDWRELRRDLSSLLK